MPTTPTIETAIETIHAVKVLTQSERDFIDNLKRSSKPDQDLIMIVSHFYAGKPWTTAMTHHLEVLSALCAMAPLTQQAA
jgi:lipopolysaccharide biosynthesis glycosyltransferase